jgi:hypothetical protein
MIVIVISPQSPIIGRGDSLHHRGTGGSLDCAQT